MNVGLHADALHKQPYTETATRHATNDLCSFRVGYLCIRSGMLHLLWRLAQGQSYTLMYRGKWDTDCSTMQQQMLAVASDIMCTDSRFGNQVWIRSAEAYS
jgi:hypothetical protein